MRQSPIRKKLLIVLALTILLGFISSAGSDQIDACNARQVGHDRLVCVCSSTTCSDLKTSWPKESGQAYVYQSSRDGKRFEFTDLSQDDSEDSKNLLSSSASISVDLSREHQAILGWGGAFTDAFGANFNSLSEDMREKLLLSYYGTNGLQYNFGRVPIGGTDFSDRSYSYDDDHKADYGLQNWSLTREDKQLKIPVVQRALRMAKDQYDVDLKLFASSWSAPGWMKTNDSLVRGHLKDNNLVYETYAEYLMKFFDSYAKEGIKFWGATVQNEPIAANLPIYFFNSMQFTNKEMIKFVGSYLGPALESRGYTKKNFKLMVGDDSLGFINRQVPEVMADKEVQKYVSGLAFHWYTSGSIVSYDHLTKLYETIKDKIEFMMMSEACEGSMPMQKRVDLGSWARAESYASDIIEDLRRQTNAWIDWNMALDLSGGPNWSGNNVDSPIIVDGSKNEFYKQPMYYSLAHFSRFLKEGSVVVDSVAKNSLVGSNIKIIAVHNKQTGHVVVNILNKSSKKKFLRLNVSDGKDLNLSLKQFTIDKRSITSILVKL